VIDPVADSLVTEFALQIPMTFQVDGCQLRDTDEIGGVDDRPGILEDRS
jgi:hypothetical protein